MFRASEPIPSIQLSLSEGCAHGIVYKPGVNTLYIVIALDFLTLLPWASMLCFLGFEGGGIHCISRPTEAIVTVISAHKGMDAQRATSWFEFPFVVAF